MGLSQVSQGNSSPFFFAKALHVVTGRVADRRSKNLFDPPSSIESDDDQVVVHQVQRGLFCIRRVQKSHQHLTHLSVHRE